MPHKFALMLCEPIYVIVNSHNSTPQNSEKLYHFGNYRLNKQKINCQVSVLHFIQSKLTNKKKFYNSGKNIYISEGCYFVIVICYCYCYCCFGKLENQNMLWHTYTNS